LKVISVRPILISDIRYWHIGCNLNYWRWNGNHTPICDMPYLRRLV